MLDDDALDKCSEPSLSEVVILNEEDELHQYEIADLKSYRLYNISVALMSHTRLGIPKAPITIRTLEGCKFNLQMAFNLTKLISHLFTAPTAPRNLKAVEINRHSINLTWDRPLEVNGELMTYELWYNDHKININDNSTMNENYTFNLEYLEAFTNYTITVRACTSNCSHSSDSLTLRTAVGEPGTMFQPTVRKFENNKILISWIPPNVKGGNLDYFQLKLIPSESHVRSAVYKINGRETSCYIEGFNCDQDSFNFVIRGVNVEYWEIADDENLFNRRANCLAYPEPIQGEVNGHFYGEWSQPAIFYCSFGYSIAQMGMVIVATIVPVFVFYLLFRFYQKLKHMQNITVILPGLFSEPLQNKPLCRGLKDLDSIKDHKLSDIEEEEEVAERENLITEQKLEGVVTTQLPLVESQRESSRTEIFLPFICNPKTNEIFYELPKKTSNSQKCVKSAPVTPQKCFSNAYVMNCTDPHVDVTTGYTKMYAPPKLRTESSTSVEGYLDMSGKSPPPARAEPIKTDYVGNEIQMFVKDSEQNNNGYIGKRASILMDPNKKLPPFVNSNGYIGLTK